MGKGRDRRKVIIAGSGDSERNPFSIPYGSPSSAT